MLRVASHNISTCGILSLLDMFNDYCVIDKFFKTNGRICFLEKKTFQHVVGKEKLDVFKMAPTTIERDTEGTSFAFKEDKYEDKWLLTGRFLSTLMVD